MTYTRDTLGRITGRGEVIDDVTRLFEYQYDTAGRLAAWLRNGSVVASYGYDANGNRTSVTTDAGTVAATYDDQDRILSIGTTTYTHTPNGERLTKTVGGQTTTYAYDAFGNLVRVDLPDGRVIRYLVDGRNRRIGKLVNDVLVKGWLYGDQLRPIAELDGQGNVVARFVYGSRTNVPDYFTKDGVDYRVIADHLGSPRAIVNVDTGEIVQRMDFDPWGVVTQDNHPGFQPFGFAGGLYDPDTGLVRFGARDYDASSAGWFAQDPAGFGGQDPNLYAYAFGDPVNNIDPDGLQTWPTNYYNQVTSAFGRERGSGSHTGADLKNPAGSPVYSTDSGTVIEAGPSGGRGGNQIRVLNEDGSVSGYAHTKPSVKVGDKVSEGDAIGESDGSGVGTGPHLHLTFRRCLKCPKEDPVPRLKKKPRTEACPVP